MYFQAFWADLGLPLGSLLLLFWLSFGSPGLGLGLGLPGAVLRPGWPTALKLKSLLMGANSFPASVCIFTSLTFWSFPFGFLLAALGLPLGSLLAPFRLPLNTIRVEITTFRVEMTPFLAESGPDTIRVTFRVGGHFPRGNKHLPRGNSYFPRGNPRGNQLSAWNRKPLAGNPRG